MFSGSRWWICALVWLVCTPVQAEEPIDKLIAQLNQSIPGGRIDAARQLAARGTAASSATETLIAALGDTQSDMRLVSAYALACVQTEPVRALTALVPVLADKDEHVRYSAQWSVARIATSIPADLGSAQAAELTGILAKAIKELRTREHQQRHLIAVELALARVEQLVPPKVVTVPVPQPTPPAVDLQAQEVIESMVRATDVVGRYQLVRRLANWNEYPDQLRIMFIEKESQQSDPSVFYYAIKRWGRPGQELLARLIMARLAAGPLTAEDDILLTELIPWSAETQQLLMDLITGPTQAGEIRWAAAGALGRSPQIDNQVLEKCLTFIDDDSQDVPLRGALLEAIAELGTQAASGEERLLQLLIRNRDEATRGILVRALASIAPTSPQAVQVIHDEFLTTSEESPLFIDLVDAASQFGPAAINCQEQLVRGLRHQDAFTRLKCINALARTGTNSGEVVQCLVDHIVSTHEEMPVKHAVAAALKCMAPAGLEAMSARIHSAVVAADETTMNNLFHALASMKTNQSDAHSPNDAGGQPVNSRAVDQLVSDCLTALSSSQSEPSTRAAAATALGSLGRAASTATLKLSELCQAEQPEVLRGACLIALAQIDPVAVRHTLANLDSGDSLLLQASAGFATHLSGDSRRGFDRLVDLLDGSESDEFIGRTIQDMGEVTQAWLVQLAANEDAPPATRQVAFRLSCEFDLPVWPALLPLLDDSQLGDEFAVCAEGPVQSDEGIECILELIESQRLRAAAQARAAGLLSPDGLGAGEDAQDWPGLTLQQPGVMKSLARNAPTAGSLAEAGEPAASGLPADAATKPNAPPMPVQQVPVSTSLSLDKPQVVEVFYGTNRGRVMHDNPHQHLAIGVLATAGGGMLVMLFCLIGFVRSGSRMFALVALVGIALAAPFGYQAADRFAQESLNTAVRYDGTYRKQIELGMCQVSIPPGHQPGQLEGPNMFKLEFRQELDKHVVLTNVQPMEKDQFFDTLHTSLQNKGKHILVFVHGYNVSFEDAARRTAQMSFDLKFPGAPVFYSWPSQANWYGYPTDKENIERSVGQIKEFLVDLARRSGAETINLVAHSMGNVGLTQALQEMEQTSPEPLFNQVVLAAPDIDASVFKERIAPAIVPKARHVTLYTSQTDLALIASRYFNNGQRVGDSAGGVLLLPGIETIDATSIDSSLIGHSYYGSNVTVLTDLGRILNNQPACLREYLQAVQSDPVPYWTFDVTKISQASSSVTR